MSTLTTDPAGAASSTLADAGSRSVEDVFARLGSTGAGLAESEATTRLAQFGAKRAAFSARDGVRDPAWPIAQPVALNVLLVRLGFPPAIIYKGDRARYMTALRRADQGDPGPLGEFLARAILENLYKFIVPAVAGPARMVALPALASREVSANALRVVAIRGRLKAAKAGDGTWRSSRAWVDEYLAARYKRT